MAIFFLCRSSQPTFATFAAFANPKMDGYEMGKLGIFLVGRCGGTALVGTAVNPRTATRRFNMLGYIS